MHAWVKTRNFEPPLLATNSEIREHLVFSFLGLKAIKSSRIISKSLSFQLGGGGGYLSTVRGTGTCNFLGVLCQTITELWVSYLQFFDISRNYGCPFQGIFHNFRNYGPDTYSSCGIMALKSTRIYGIMGTNFSGKMARPRHIIG